MEKQFHMRHFSDGQENILGLDDPDVFSCRVHTYGQGHSILLIQLLDSRNMEKFEPQYVIFDAVHYFEGHIGWTGANLCVRPYEIVINPMETSNLVRHSVSMFAFLAGDNVIKIWSGSTITFTDTFPEMLHSLNSSDPNH